MNPAVRTISAGGWALIALGFIHYGICQAKTASAKQCEPELSFAVASITGGAGTLIGLNTLNPALRTPAAPPAPPEPKPMPVAIEPLPVKRKPGRPRKTPPAV